MADKIRIKPNVFAFPMPVTLVGATVGGKPNFLAVGWVSRVNVAPPMIMVALGNGHYTPAGIDEHDAFSVNVPSSDMLEATDYCGIVSGAAADKSELFDVFYGKLEAAPMIAECPVCMECKVVRKVELPADSVYIGEIIAAYSEEKYLGENKQPDIKKVNPFCLTMMDKNYRTLSDSVGTAWQAGENYKPGG